MNQRKLAKVLGGAFFEAEEEIGRLMKRQLSAFLADAKGLSRRGREALIDVYAGETKRAVIDGYVRALEGAYERIVREKSASRRGSKPRRGSR